MSDPHGTPQPRYGQQAEPGQPGQPGEPGHQGQQGRYGQPAPPQQPGYPQHPGAPGYAGPYAAQGPAQGHRPPAQQGDDTMWAMMTYIGTIVVGFLAPLIIYFVKRGESQFVRFHAAQCLNYAITVTVYVFLVIGASAAILVPSISAEWVPGVVIGGVLAGVSIFGLIIVQFVYLILAMVRSSRYEWYRMPSWICWRMIK